MIGKRLAEVRKYNGDTQADLARKMFVNANTKSSPSHEMLVKICQLYGVSADYLLGLTRADPGQAKRTRERLTKEELAEVQNYSEYLLWRRTHGGDRMGG